MYHRSLVQDRPIISSIRRLSKTFGIPSPTKSPGHSMSSKYSSAMSSFRRSTRERAQQSGKNQALKSQVMMQHGQVDITYRISNSSKGILVECRTLSPAYFVHDMISSTLVTNIEHSEPLKGENKISTQKRC